jgi:hypothetical protein
VLAGGTCLREVTVDTVGYGVVDDLGARGSNTAVLEALANAVTRVRGAFVQVETRLVDSFSQRFGDRELRIDDASRFARVVEERASGLITRYEVLAIGVEAGLVTATVRATVCADGRLAVRWTGAAAAEAPFLGALRSAFRASGWQVVAEGHPHHADLVLASLTTGATHVAHVRMGSRDAGTFHGLRAVDVTLAVDVQDITGCDVVVGLQRTVSAVGRTVAEAEASAGAEVANALANAILQAITGPPAAPRRLTVIGARRPNTALEIQRAAAAVAGVPEVNLGASAEHLQYDLRTARSMCDVADELAAQRRMLIVVEACSEAYATVRVLRE